MRRLRDADKFARNAHRVKNNEECVAKVGEEVRRHVELV